MPYDARLSNKSPGTGGGGWDVSDYGICLCKWPLAKLSVCFSGSSWTSACQWDVLNESLILLCLRGQLLCCLINSIISTHESLCLPLNFFLSVPQQKGMSERQGGCSDAGWGQPSTMCHQHLQIIIEVMYLVRFRIYNIWSGRQGSQEETQDPFPSCTVSAPCAGT